MMKALYGTLILALLLAGGCGNGGDGNNHSDGSQTDGSDASRGNGDDGNNHSDGSQTDISAASRDAFIGTWKGKYLGLDDEMIIKAGESDTEVVITLHANHGDAADTVKGNLVAADRIEVPEQSIGNRPGTAVITMTDGKLTLEQSEARGTAKGTGYEKQ